MKALLLIALASILSCQAEEKILVSGQPNEPIYSVASTSFKKEAEAILFYKKLAVKNNAINAVAIVVEKEVMLNAAITLGAKFMLETEGISPFYTTSISGVNGYVISDEATKKILEDTIPMKLFVLLKQEKTQLP